MLPCHPLLRCAFSLRRHRELCLGLARVISLGCLESHPEILICKRISIDGLLSFHMNPLELCIPWLFTAYRKDVMISCSWIIAALKSFLTIVASCSLPVRWDSFPRAMVGDIRPMPGRASSLWLHVLVKGEGTSK